MNRFIIAGITLGVVSIFFLLISSEEDYDYPEPNAYVHGQQVAGTVYVSDPENSPGLGWIL